MSDRTPHGLMWTPPTPEELYRLQRAGAVTVRVHRCHDEPEKAQPAPIRLTKEQREQILDCHDPFDEQAKRHGVTRADIIEVKKNKGKR